MSYRVRYIEIKPGGHRDWQDEAVRGTLEDVRNHLARYNVEMDTVSITEYTQSDSTGRPVSL